MYSFKNERIHVIGYLISGTDPTLRISATVYCCTLPAGLTVTNPRRGELRGEV